MKKKKEEEIIYFQCPGCGTKLNSGMAKNGIVVCPNCLQERLVPKTEKVNDNKQRKEHKKHDYKQAGSCFALGLLSFFKAIGGLFKKIFVGIGNFCRTLYRKKPIVLPIVFLLCSAVFFIISAFIFNGVRDIQSLNAGKIYKCISCAFSVISVVCAITVYRKKGRDLFATIVIIALVVVAVTVNFDYFTVYNVYSDDNNGVIYLERADGYEAKITGDLAEVVLFGEMNSKAVISVSSCTTSKTQKLTLSGGKWNLNLNNFKQAFNLKKLVIDSADVTAINGTFSKSERLKEVVLINGLLSQSEDTDFSSCSTYEARTCIFANSDVGIYLNNSSLIGLVDNIQLLELSGKSNVKITGEIKNVVLNEGANMLESDVERNIPTFLSTRAKYFSIGNSIYIPANITVIPDCFFGDELSSGQKKIDVYYGGTKEQWAQITIGQIGNNNYFSEKVTVIYEQTM